MAEMEIDMPLHAKLLDMCHRPEYADVVVTLISYP